MLTRQLPAPAFGSSKILCLAPLCLLATAALVASVPSPAAGNAGSLGGDGRRGAALYETRCAACHSLDKNRVGPSHRGVFGRKAGVVKGYAYSPALKKSGIVWNAFNLNIWLANPVAMVPGTRMGIRTASAQDRADIIAYLRHL